MSRVAILEPTSLLGQEVRAGLDRHPELGDEIVLLASDPEEQGTVTDVRGAAALVAAAEPSALEGIDLVFACGELEPSVELLAGRPAGTSAVLLSPEATARHGRPIVAGVTGRAAEPGELVLSPHPAAIALALLLHPLAEVGAVGAAATVVQPVSLLGGRALDQLFEQTRDVLSMSGERAETIFGRQLAFNLYPAPGGGRDLPALVRAATGRDTPVAVQALQGNIFHSLSISLLVELADDPGRSAVVDALAEQPHVRLALDDELEPGPFETTSDDDVVVGGLEPAAGRTGAYWLWATVDNLTRGGAANALEIARPPG